MQESPMGKRREEGSAFISETLVRRLVADSTGVSADEAARVLDAYAGVVLSLVHHGAKVRALGHGYFELSARRRTRRLSPITGGYVVVPAKEKLVFRESRKK